MSPPHPQASARTCISGACDPGLGPDHSPREGTIIPLEGDEAVWVPRDRGQLVLLLPCPHATCADEAGAPQPGPWEPNMSWF